MFYHFPLETVDGHPSYHYADDRDRLIKLGERKKLRGYVINKNALKVELSRLKYWDRSRGGRGGCVDSEPPKLKQL